MAQAESLHLQRRSDQGRNVLDENLSCDIQPTKCASFDQVAWIVEATKVDREHFIFADIHMRTKEIQKYVPCSNEALLINAGEESSKVLVVQPEMATFWSLSKDREKVVDITCCKVVRAGNRNELKDHPSQNVEHRTEWCTHEGDDRSIPLS